MERSMPGMAFTSYNNSHIPRELHQELEHLRYALGRHVYGKNRSKYFKGKFYNPSSQVMAQAYVRCGRSISELKKDLAMVAEVLDQDDTLKPGNVLGSVSSRRLLK